MNSASIYIKERKENTMTVIAMKKDSFDVVQINNVTRIDYNATSKLYTITYGEGQTKVFNSDYVISVLFS